MVFLMCDVWVTDENPEWHLKECFQGEAKKKKQKWVFHRAVPFKSLGQKRQSLSSINLHRNSFNRTTICRNIVRAQSDKTKKSWYWCRANSLFFRRSRFSHIIFKQRFCSVPFLDKAYLFLNWKQERTHTYSNCKQRQI